MAPPQAVAVCGACFALCWFLAFWIVVIVTGTMCIKNFEEYDTFERVGIDQLTNVYAMGRDWQKEPFTELKVVDTNTCGQGFEPVYEKTFYGLDVACDCLGIFDRWIPYDNTFILESRGCIYNETRAGCTDADPMMPYYMNRIQDKLLCGKVGSSLPYANITRVDPTTLNCTDGLVECIDRTVPDYTPDV